MLSKTPIQVLTLTCAVLLTPHFTPKHQSHHLPGLAFLSTAPLYSEKPPEFFLSSSVGKAQPGLGMSGWTAKKSGSGCSVTFPGAARTPPRRH